MTKKVFLILILCLIVALVGIIAGVCYAQWHKATQTTVDDVLEATMAKREIAPISTPPVSAPTTSTPTLPTTFDSKKINILLLGLDSRKSATTSHCDAIHMFTLDLEKMTIQITSVPRGTYVYIPPGNYAPNQYYLSNACALAGHDYTIKQIEKLLGIQADYIVKVGFSQTLGILRTFSLPTTESLQWLRNRHSFGIGDPQRSHNQATFIKDVIIKKIDSLSTGAMLPILKIGYLYIDTDMNFETLYVLVRAYAASGLAEHPERIELRLKSKRAVKEYHFNFKDPQKFIDQFPHPGVSTSSPTLGMIQKDLITYIEKRLSSKQSIEDVLQKFLWLQVEDEKTREGLHFRILEREVKETNDPHEKAFIIDNYIFEKNSLGLTAWAQKGQGLLDAITTTTPQTNTRP